MAGSAGLARRALFLAAPTALALTFCSAGRRHSVHPETFAVDSTDVNWSSLNFPPSCSNLAQKAQELATGRLFMRGLDVASEAIRDALSSGRDCLLLGPAGVLRAPWYASSHDEKKAWSNRAFSFSWKAASSPQNAESESVAENGPQEGNSSAGPPAQAVSFVFGRVEELSKRSYDFSTSMDARTKDLVYTPLAKELLKSWDAYPDTFESVFWDALKKLQAGNHTAYGVNDFVASFLVDGELAVGNKMGAKLLGYVFERMLVEARTNPDSVQVGRLESLAVRINLSLSQAKRKDLLHPFFTEDGYYGRLTEDFRKARKENAAEARALAASIPAKLPPWASHTTTSK